MIQPGDVIYNQGASDSLPCWYWGKVKEKCDKTKSMKVQTGLKETLVISAKSPFDLRTLTIYFILFNDIFSKFVFFLCFMYDYRSICVVTIC